MKIKSLHSVGWADSSRPTNAPAIACRKMVGLEDSAHPTNLSSRSFFVLFVPLWLILSSQPACAAEPTYWQDIRPILRKNCTVCHNVKNLKEDDVSGGLALDSYEAILKGKHGRVVRLGKSGDSLIVKMITVQTAEDAEQLFRAAIEDKK